MSIVKLSELPGYEGFIKPFVGNKEADDKKAAGAAISMMMTLTRAGIGIEIDQELIPGAFFRLDFREDEGLNIFVVEVASLLDGQDSVRGDFDMNTMPRFIAEFDRDIYKAGWLATGRRFEDIIKEIEASRAAALLAGRFEDFLQEVMGGTEEGFMGERRDVDPATRKVQSIENTYYVHEQGGFASQWTYKEGQIGEVLAHREFRRMLLRLNPVGTQLTSVNLSRMKVL